MNILDLPPEQRARALARLNMTEAEFREYLAGEQAAIAAAPEAKNPPAATGKWSAENWGMTNNPPKADDT